MICYTMIWSAPDANPSFERQTILNFLDTVPLVLNWRASTGAIFVITNADLATLFQVIHNRFPGLYFALIPTAITNIQGWSDEATWDFIRRPRQTGHP